MSSESMETVTRTQAELIDASFSQGDYEELASIQNEVVETVDERKRVEQKVGVVGQAYVLDYDTVESSTDGGKQLRVGVALPDDSGTGRFRLDCESENPTKKSELERFLDSKGLDVDSMAKLKFESVFVYYDKDEQWNVVWGDDEHVFSEMCYGSSSIPFVNSRYELNTYGCVKYTDLYKKLRIGGFNVGFLAVLSLINYGLSVAFNKFAGIMVLTIAVFIVMWCVIMQNIDNVSLSYDKCRVY